MRFAASSLLAATLFLGITPLATTAYAQGDPNAQATPAPEEADVSDADKERAKRLFDEGRQLLTEGSIAAACAKFKESQKVRPGVGTLYNLADCNEKLGKTGTAYGLFAEVAERSKAALRPDREQKARERMTVLEPKLMKIRLAVPPNGIKGVKSITIDGEMVSPDDYNKAIASDPGEHVVVAITTKDDGEPFEESVDLDEAGKTVTVAIPVAPGRKMQRRVGMIVGGAITAAVGIGALGTAIWLGTSDGGEDTAPIAVGLGILGIAGLAVGIPIFAVGFRKKPVRSGELDDAPLLEPSPIPQLAIGPTGGSLTWQF